MHFLFHVQIQSHGDHLCNSVKEVQDDVTIPHSAAAANFTVLNIFSNKKHTPK